MVTWVRQPAEYDHDKPLHVNRYRDRGSVRCGCGAEVDLECRGDSQCEQCGQLFNAVGQMLRPESEWEERYDDDY